MDFVVYRSTGGEQSYLTDGAVDRRLELLRNKYNALSKDYDLGNALRMLDYDFIVDNLPDELFFLRRDEVTALLLPQIYSVKGTMRAINWFMSIMGLNVYELEGWLEMNRKYLRGGDPKYSEIKCPHTWRMMLQHGYSSELGLEDVEIGAGEKEEGIVPATNLEFEQRFFAFLKRFAWVNISEMEVWFLVTLPPDTGVDEIYVESFGGFYEEVLALGVVRAKERGLLPQSFSGELDLDRFLAVTDRTTNYLNLSEVCETVDEAVVKPREIYEYDEIFLRVDEYKREDNIYSNIISMNRTWDYLADYFPNLVWEVSPEYVGGMLPVNPIEAVFEWDTGMVPVSYSWFFYQSMSAGELFGGEHGLDLSGFGENDYIGYDLTWKSMGVAIWGDAEGRYAGDVESPVPFDGRIVNDNLSVSWADFDYNYIVGYWGVGRDNLPFKGDGTQLPEDPVFDQMVSWSGGEIAYFTLQQVYSVRKVVVSVGGLSSEVVAGSGEFLGFRFRMPMNNVVAFDMPLLKGIGSGSAGGIEQMRSTFAFGSAVDVGTFKMELMGSGAASSSGEVHVRIDILAEG
jgi:hypothetical protein